MARVDRLPGEPAPNTYWHAHCYSHQHADADTYSYRDADRDRDADCDRDRHTNSGGIANLYPDAGHGDAAAAGCADMRT